MCVCVCVCVLECDEALLTIPVIINGAQVCTCTCIQLGGKQWLMHLKIKFDDFSI